MEESWMNWWEIVGKSMEGGDLTIKKWYSHQTCWSKTGIHGDIWGKHVIREYTNNLMWYQWACL
jgi:hypothetical protein